MKGLTVAIAGIMMVGMIGCSQAEPKESLIADVTSAWKHTYTDKIHTLLNGSLAIHVRGEIDGAGIIRTSYGNISLESGPIDVLLIGHEYWNNKCEVIYEPTSATTGHLSICVGLGSKARYMMLPICKAAPPDGYNGGWTTWHTDRKTKCSEGYYTVGRKTGGWNYWAEDGSPLRSEVWNNGELTKTFFANKAVEGMAPR